MHRTILVAATPDHEGRSALALGAELARPFGAEVVLAGIATGRRDMPEDEAALAEKLRLRVSEMPELPPGIPVSVRVHWSDSVVHGLRDLVAEIGAEVLVVGPSHRGALKRIFGDIAVSAGTQGTGCAVAVACADPVDRLRRIGVAWDDGPQSAEALEWAVQLSERCAAELTIIRVLDARHPEGTTPEDGTAERTEAVVAAARARTSASSRLVWGDPGDELLELSHDLDLLVMGSRPRGTVRRTLLGGVSTKLVHDAHCPVVVIPPGVRAPADTAAV